AGVARLWAEVLALDEVGIHDPLLDLGGHSLLAARLLARLRDSYGVDVSLAALWAAPTVAGVASAIVVARAAPAGEAGIESMLGELEAMPEADARQCLQAGLPQAPR